jgi:hypothetical protein
MRSKLVGALTGFLLATISAAVDAHEPRQGKTQGKKLIEWGWDEPDTKFMRTNIAQMEQFPFDGLVFHVNSSKGGKLHLGDVGWPQLCPA